MSAPSRFAGRTWTLRAVLVVLLLALAGRVFQIVYWKLPRIAYEDYCRIERGMSRAEVEAIFGDPPNYREVGMPESRAGRFCWEGYAGEASVQFDDAGRVVAKRHLSFEAWDQADAHTKKRMASPWHWDRLNPWPRYKSRG